MENNLVGQLDRCSIRSDSLCNTCVHRQRPNTFLFHNLYIVIVVVIFEKISEWMHENLQGEESVDYWHDAIYDANFKDLKLKAEYPGCVYFDVTFPYEYDIKINKMELSGTN